MDNVEEVKNCIADGIDINELHYHEFNYLTDAACHNSLAALQFLIDSGADVNYKHHDGTSPIYYAKIYNRPEAIEILYRAGSKL